MHKYRNKFYFRKLVCCYFFCVTWPFYTVGSLFVLCCFPTKSLIKCEPSQDTVCSLNSPISPASKNRAPIRYESAKSF